MKKSLAVYFVTQTSCKNHACVLQIVDLRRELECRTLSSKGLKSQLIARLTKALKSEQEKEKSDDADKKENQVSPSLLVFFHQFYIHSLYNAEFLK